MSDWQPPLWDDPPQAIISQSVLEYADDPRNHNCHYCGEPFTYDPQHTCTDYLNDVYRVGGMYQYGTNGYALVLEGGETLRFFNIPPGQVREMDIQEFNSQVETEKKRK